LGNDIGEFGQFVEVDIRAVLLGAAGGEFFVKNTGRVEGVEKVFYVVKTDTANFLGFFL
jgi:hypothetical protein